MTDPAVKADQKKFLKKNRHLTITELSSEFPQISQSLPHKTVKKKLPQNFVPNGCRISLVTKIAHGWIVDIPRGPRTRTVVCFSIGDVVIGDEIPVKHRETNESQCAVVAHESPLPRKAKETLMRTLSEETLMATVFRSTRGLLLELIF